MYSIIFLQLNLFENNNNNIIVQIPKFNIIKILPKERIEPERLQYLNIFLSTVLLLNRKTKEEHQYNQETFAKLYIPDSVKSIVD
jgi:hypothetical protein